MRIGGLGTDLIQVNRIGAVLGRFESKFLSRTLHPWEIERYHTLSFERKENYVASRWAVKEAVLKAVGHRILFPDILAFTSREQSVHLGGKRTKQANLG